MSKMMSLEEMGKSSRARKAPSSSGLNNTLNALTRNVMSPNPAMNPQTGAPMALGMAGAAAPMMGMFGGPVQGALTAAAGGYGGQYPSSPKAQQQVENARLGAGSAAADANRMRQQRQQFNSQHQTLNQARDPNADRLRYDQLNGMDPGLYQRLSGQRPDYSGFVQNAQVPEAIRRENALYGQGLAGAPITQRQPMGEVVSTDTLETAAKNAGIVGGYNNGGKPLTPMKVDPQKEALRKAERQAQGSAAREQNAQRRLDERTDRAQRQPLGSTARQSAQQRALSNQQDHELQLAALTAAGRAPRTSTSGGGNDIMRDMWQAATDLYRDAEAALTKARSLPKHEQDAELIKELTTSRDAARKKADEMTQRYEAMGQNNAPVASDLNPDEIFAALPPARAQGLRADYEQADDPAVAATIIQKFRLDPSRNYTADELRAVLLKIATQSLQMSGSR